MRDVEDSERRYIGRVLQRHARICGFLVLGVSAHLLLIDVRAVVVLVVAAAILASSVLLFRLHMAQILDAPRSLTRAGASGDAGLDYSSGNLLRKVALPLIVYPVLVLIVGFGLLYGVHHNELTFVIIGAWGLAALVTGVWTAAI